MKIYVKNLIDVISYLLPSSFTSPHPMFSLYHQQELEKKKVF